MKLFHSHSSIKLYETCPQQYYRLRIAKDVTPTQSEVSLYGDRVHESFEERIKLKTPLPEDIKRFEPVIKKIEDSPKKEKIAECKLAVNEVLKPVSYKAPDAWLRGKIDVLAINDTDASIIDWKTGKRRVEYLSFDQLKINALLVFANHPTIERVKGGYVWVMTNKTDSVEYDRKDINLLWADVIKKIRNIYRSVENDNWPARPSGLCKTCPAFSTCSYAQR